MATCKELNSTMEFPFIKHLDTVKHIRKSKVMIVIRGLPGSGKSTLAQAIRCSHPARIIVPDRDATVQKPQKRSSNVQYNWSQSELSRESCRLMASASCAKEIHTIVIDDDNIKMEHMKGYFEIANQHGYMVLVIEPCTPWKFDAHHLSKMNTRGIDVGELNWMMSQWETSVPISFGWTLNSADTKRLIDDVTRDVLTSISVIPALIQDFKQKGISNIQSHFIPANKHGVLQCISCFCMKNEGRCVMYTQQPAVQMAYGKVSDMKIIGFVITKDTFTARVKLSNEQLRVWYQDDNLPSAKVPLLPNPFTGAEHPNYSKFDEYDDVKATKDRIKSKQGAANAVQVGSKKYENPQTKESVTELMVKIRIDNSDLSGQLSAAILDGLAIRIRQTTPGQEDSQSKTPSNGKMMYEEEMSAGKKGKGKKQQLDNFKSSPKCNNNDQRRPVLEIGSRAHILIGRARGAQSVQGGLDVLKVVEHEVYGKPIQMIACKHGKLLKHAENLWYFSLNQEIILKSLFTGCF